MRNVELTDEEVSAAAVLAVGELQAIRTICVEENREPAIEEAAEIQTLISLANKCRPEGTEPIMGWDEIQPLQEEEEV